MLFENHTEMELGTLVPDLFLFFKKVLHVVKANGQHLVLIYFGRSRLGHAIKINIITF